MEEPAYHFEPKAQYLVSPLLGAVTIIGAGR